jgi:hypothetical protein
MDLDFDEAADACCCDALMDGKRMEEEEKEAR